MRKLTLLLTLISALLPPLAIGAKADDTGSNMADAARRFVAALDDKQKDQATFAFDSPERFNWHWIPRERKGVPIKNLAPEQRALAFGLLNTGLSTKGMIKATTVMSLEEILRVEEHGTGPVRDPELYYVSVFGPPSEHGLWGWRVEGHHLSLNYTLRDGKVVSATPFMFGSNPAQVQSGRWKGLRNLNEIEAPVNELITSLDGAQRKAAIVSALVPDVTTTPNSARLTLSTPEGISSEKLSADQRSLLSKFIAAYSLNFPESIRADLSERLARGDHTFHFAWFGPPDPTKPHAFRVQGSSLYIDFNDKQNEANHIHTYYRSVDADFGMAVAP